MADKFREAGFVEAADEMEIFAKQEGHHGVVLAKILEKHWEYPMSVKDKNEMLAIIREELEKDYHRLMQKHSNHFKEKK